MKRNIQLAVGSVIGWKGKNYKVVVDNAGDLCEQCELKKECGEIPFLCWSTVGCVGCSLNDNGFEMPNVCLKGKGKGVSIHFEEIGGAK